jgi:hypothetical protein
MRSAVVFLTLICLLAGCGGAADNGANKAEVLKDRARPAEANLVKIRDALVAYYKKNGKAPESVSDLGIKDDELANEDYSELGYGFYNLKFDKDGKLAQGWLIATPMADRDALKVRMNAVTGEFDYVGKDEDFGAAPSDNGPVNTPAAND